jgi:arylsulfatase A-like enzyme
MAVLVHCGCHEAPPGSDPNGDLSEIDTVILISIDSLRADRLGAYGHSAPTSPTLDGLAAAGLLFTRAYSTTSWTLPSHAAMLSGFDDYAHGAYQARSPISSGITTLPERLRQAGVENTGFFAGPFLHPSYGFARGFDHYIDATSYGWNPEGELGHHIPHAASHRDITNPIVLERVRSWLDARADGLNDGAIPTRSFIFIHLWDVHYDYIPPVEYVTIFDPDYTGTLSGEDFLDNPRIRPGMPERDLQHLLALYDAEIRYTDDTLAQLLELFETKNMLEKGAVIVTADHGEEFFDHGRVGHGLTLHEEVLRVPLILWLPARRPIRSISERVTSHIDIAPTVCALLAVNCQYDGIGNSLLPDYLEPDLPAGRQDALAELTNTLFNLDLTARVDSKGVVVLEKRSGRISYSSIPGPGRRKKPTHGNIQTLDRLPKTIRGAVNQLRDRNAEARMKGALLDHGAKPDQKSIDPATIDRLRALGYLGDETP